MGLLFESAMMERFSGFRGEQTEPCHISCAQRSRLLMENGEFIQKKYGGRILRIETDSDWRSLRKGMYSEISITKTPLIPKHLTHLAQVIRESEVLQFSDHFLNVYV